jgi:plastocyanin
MTMKDLFKSTLRCVVSFVVVLVMAGVSTSALSATQWEAWVGAQSPDLGSQAMAFFPNELWIHSGDSIRFTFAANEAHTLSFLTPGPPGQIRLPPFQKDGVTFVGCPGTTPDGSSFIGSSCVTSGPSTTGQTYTVNFPTVNNFKLVCLIHFRMTGAIHVLPMSQTLPHDQSFYNQQADLERNAVLSEASDGERRGNAASEETSAQGVTAGVEEVLGNGGGSQIAAVVRFFGATTVVHVGDTVEWTIMSPSLNHTVTFGTQPADIVDPTPGLPQDLDGVLHAVISPKNPNVSSGFIGIATQEAIFQPQSPPDATRFRVTFPVAGTFKYYCILHDNLNMVGTVIVF